MPGLAVDTRSGELYGIDDSGAVFHFGPTRWPGDWYVPDGDDGADGQAIAFREVTSHISAAGAGGDDALFRVLDTGATELGRLDRPLAGVSGVEPTLSGYRVPVVQTDRVTMIDLSCGDDRPAVAARPVFTG